MTVRKEAAQNFRLELSDHCLALKLRTNGMKMLNITKPKVTKKKDLIFRTNALIPIVNEAFIHFINSCVEAVKNEGFANICRRFRGWSFFVFVPQANAWGYMLWPFHGHACSIGIKPRSGSSM